MKLKLLKIAWDGLHDNGGLAAAWPGLKNYSETVGERSGAHSHDIHLRSAIS